MGIDGGMTKVPRRSESLGVVFGLFESSGLDLEDCPFLDLFVHSVVLPSVMFSSFDSSTNSHRSSVTEKGKKQLRFIDRHDSHKDRTISEIF